MRWWLGVALAAVGCVALPRPGLADVARARERWPETDLAALEQGRTTYASRCAGCHGLVLPDEHPPDAWPKLMKEMVTESKVTPSEAAAIERFLVTMAQRPPAPR